MCLKYFKRLFHQVCAGSCHGIETSFHRSCQCTLKVMNRQCTLKVMNLSKEWRCVHIALYSTMVVHNLSLTTADVDYFAWQLFCGLATSMYYTNISWGKFLRVYITT